MDGQLRRRVLELRDYGRTPRDIVTMLQLPIAEVDRVIEEDRQARMAEGVSCSGSLDLSEPVPRSVRVGTASAPVIAAGRPAPRPKREARVAPPAPRDEPVIESKPEPSPRPQGRVEEVFITSIQAERMRRQREECVRKQERLKRDLVEVTGRITVLDMQLALPVVEIKPTRQVITEGELAKEKKPRVISAEGRERMRVNGLRQAARMRAKAAMGRAGAELEQQARE